MIARDLLRRSLFIIALTICASAVAQTKPAAVPDGAAWIEAAQDLYASKLQAFLRVTLPLSLPGVFAGTLLTFIPAAGDFINAQLLGTPRQSMVGNVIQSKFLELIDYPAAASLSFILMALILAALLVYARAVGTERLTG